MNIGQIEEILYLPSVRCNLNCKHCGEDQDIPKSEEVDCSFILEKIEESVLVDKDAMIAITGGEPFLNTTFSSFILKGLEKTNRKFHITSNGFLFDDIVRMADQVSDLYRERCQFSISIDGLKQTHNAIRRNPKSFDLALNTAKYLADKGMLASTNTVIQEDNLQELDDFKLFFRGISPEIKCSMGPLIVECAEDQNYEYSKEYQEKSWGHLYSMLDRKAVLAKGHYRIRHCHAGMKNITIAPDGKVYACLTGAFYRGKNESQNYCLGDLKLNSLDQILTDIKRRRSVCEEVFSCKGCANNCTLVTENRFFGLDIGLSEDEVLRAFELEKKLCPEKRSIMMGDGLIDTVGWYEIEKDAGRVWCWSNRLVSKVFIPITGNHAHIIISYSKIVESQRLKVLVDGTETYSQLSNDGQDIKIEIPRGTEKPFITVTFVIDKLHRPAELFESSDSRQLGICLTKIELVGTDGI